MTSNISNITPNIDTNFPVQGQDNPSQGFRDNFAQIVMALDTAGNEITAVQKLYEQSSYTLTTATQYSLGGVKIDSTASNISITGDGTISVTPFNTATLVSHAILADSATSVAGGYVGTITAGTGTAVSSTGNNFTVWNTVPAYTLPAATSNALGGVKQGSNVTIAGDGTISVAAAYQLPIANPINLGGVKIGANVLIDADGVISVATPYTLPMASPVTLGGVKIGNNINVSGSGTISVAAPFVLNTATSSIVGGIKIGANVSISADGTISVGAPYVLPTAAPTQTGGIKVGNNLTMDGAGFLNGTYNTATNVSAGIVKVGTNLSAAADGTMSVANPYVLSTYTTSTLNTIATTQTGAMVFVSNAPGGAQPCYFTGSTWYTINGRIRVV